MSFLSDDDVAQMGFRFVGENVRISSHAKFYFPADVAIGDNSRIDDFCVVAGRVDIGRNVHVTVFGNLAGGRAGLHIGDFSTLAYGCHLIAQSDDYSGATMTNSTVPSRYKNETVAAVRVGRHVILGTNCVVLPGVDIADGTAGGAMTLFTRSTDPWSIYVGQPARRVGERLRQPLEMEQALMNEQSEKDVGK